MLHAAGKVARFAGQPREQPGRLPPLAAAHEHLGDPARLRGSWGGRTCAKDLLGFVEVSPPECRQETLRGVHGLGWGCHP
jgi:hypothetical protein